MLGQGCACHSNENLSEAQNKFQFVFVKEKLKLNTAKSLSALSRLLSRTLQFQIWVVFAVLAYLNGNYRHSAASVLSEILLLGPE